MIRTVDALYLQRLCNVRFFFITFMRKNGDSLAVHVGETEPEGGKNNYPRSTTWHGCGQKCELDDQLLFLMPRMALSPALS
jgi:hypothetical protein